MKKWQIDKNIPLPPKGKPGHREHSFPFDSLEIGDSFLIGYNAPPYDGGKEFNKQFSNMRGALSRYNKQSSTKIKVTTRQVDDEELGTGLRVWRIS